MDILLICVAVGLLAMMFRQRITQALTMLSSCMSIGALFSTFSIAINLFSLTTKVYYVITVNLIATVCYIVLEVCLRKEIL